MSGINRLCRNCFSAKRVYPCPVCGYTKDSVKHSRDYLPPGVKIAGRYILGGVIGRGGFGITYLAYDTKADKKTVIKEYFPAMLARRERLRVLPTGSKNAEQFNLGAERFFDEAEMVSRFNGNPSIVSIYDCFYANNTAYFAMEYLDGITLENYVKKFGALSTEETLYIAERLAMALTVLHSGRVLHRDIAPDNIMICRDGRIKLIDFGAARRIAPKGALGHTVMIKSGFTPPEQYDSKDSHDERTDIYSLGTSLYYALTGNIPPDPYRRTDDGVFLNAPANVPNGLWSVIVKACAVKAAQRYESAERLQKALNGLDIKGRPIALPDGFNALSDNGASAARNKNRYLPFAVCGATAAGAALILTFTLRNDLVTVSRDPPIQSYSAPTRETSDAVYVAAPAPNNESFTWNELVNIPELSDPVELRLDSEYKGHFKPAGHISSEYLKGFGGDVKITVGVERWEGTAPDNIQGIIPVDSEGNCVLNYLSSSANSWADDNGYINLDPGMASYSFVISRQGIDRLGDGGLFFEGYNVILTSARLTKSREMFPYNIRSFADSDIPVVTRGDGSAIVEFTDYTATGWGGVQTGSISQSAFDAISGDVKVTLSFEHLPQANDYWHTIFVRNSGYCFNVFDDDFLVPMIRDGSGNALIQRGGDYSIVPDASLSECVFIIPERVKPKMSGGIFFQSSNAAVRSAKLEPYNGEYEEFAEWSDDI